MSKFTAFTLSQETRQALLNRFPPKYATLKADHITHRFGAEDLNDLFHPKTVEITGTVDDGYGLQALVVKVNGQSNKPDGRPYHITWSLDPTKEIPDELKSDKERLKNKAKKYKPVHSNNLLIHAMKSPGKPFTIEPIEPPVPITVKPVLIDQKSATDRSITELPRIQEQQSSIKQTPPYSPDI